MGSPLEGVDLAFGLHMREQKHEVLTVQTFNNCHQYCPIIRKKTNKSTCRWRCLPEMEVRANRTKRQCSKSMNSMYSKEFRFSITLKTTIFLHFSSFIVSFSWELFFEFFEKRCWDLTTFPFKRKTASLNHMTKHHLSNVVKVLFIFPCTRMYFCFTL